MFKKKLKKTKENLAKFRKEVEKAYYLGYKNGFQDSAFYPDNFAIPNVSSLGYKDGVRDSKKKEKIKRKYKKSSTYK